MIYDCFTFFNELDLLEIRLNVLDGVVDRFVIVEATRTHSNKPKELVFQANAARFDKFLHKITYIAVDDYPEFETAWTNENHQRNCIERGLRDCRDDDVILISDLDEIPRPEKIHEYRNTPGIKSFEQGMFYYYLNHLCVRNTGWSGTRMLSYHDFKHGLDDVRNYGHCNIEKLNRGTTATKIRIYKKGVRVSDGGWHFSYLGGAEAVREKIQASSHEELNFEEYRNLRNIEKRMNDDFSLHRLVGLKIDETFPAYIRENIDCYEKYVGPVTPSEIVDRIRRTAQFTAVKDRGMRLATQLLVAFIPIKSWRKRARMFFAVRLYGMTR